MGAGMEGMAGVGIVPMGGTCPGTGSAGAPIGMVGAGMEGMAGVGIGAVPMGTCAVGIEGTASPP